MKLKEGIGDVFKDMPSLGQLKDDAYRYLVAHNSPLVDKVDKTRFDTERIVDIENPRYFNSGPNKNRFQLPNRIIPDKTQLYLKFYINTSTNRMNLEIGMNLKSKKDLKVDPYCNNDIKILDFINEWTNNTWSRELELAVSYFKKSLGINNSNNNFKTLGSLLKNYNVDRDELLSKLVDKFPDGDKYALSDKIPNADLLEVLDYLCNKNIDLLFGKSNYIDHLDDNEDDILDNTDFISKLSKLLFDTYNSGKY